MIWSPSATTPASASEPRAQECDDAVCYASAGDDPYNVAVRRCAAAVRALKP